MLTLQTLLGVALLACGGGADEKKTCGYLYEAGYVLDKTLRGTPTPYEPQSGDIMFSTDWNPVWQVLFNLAGTGHPHHSAIIVRRRDGDLAVLEAGPYDGFTVELLEPLTHFGIYEAKGAVWIRRRKTPLTPEQDARLTDWAEAQNKRRFAAGRLAGQMTIFRSRGPIRTRWVGGPHGARSAYFCCELLMESLVATGLVDTVNTRPAATYPRDVFFDESRNPWINEHTNLSADWQAPARWTSLSGMTEAIPAP
jgi:hypothetical protein